MGRHSLAESFRELKELILTMFPWEICFVQKEWRPLTCGKEGDTGAGVGGGVSDDTGTVWAASSSFFVILIFPILGSVPLGAYSYLSL